VTVRDVEGVEVAGALTRAAAAGGFFAVELGPIERMPSAPGQAPWRPWSDLTDLTDGPGVIGVRIDATRVALAARVGGDPEGIEVRVAASLVQLGLAGRLISLALGPAVLGGVVPDLGTVTPGRPAGTPAERGGLWWQDVLGGPVPMALPRPRGRAADPGDLDALADLFVADVLDGPVAGLGRAVNAHTPLSAKILRGNVASALGGAVKMLSAAVPDRADAALGLANRLLAREPLAGTGAFVFQPDDGGPRPGWAFTRTSCCLFYRVPGGGLCGDCVLVRARV
jgi:hypothetical protein